MNCISISHKKTPIKMRELFAFSVEEKMEFEKHILTNNQIFGCVIVSTCNRSEIYFSGDKCTIGFVEKELATYKKIDQNKIRNYINRYSNKGAIRHLFRVTCGMDSMVLGEDEILRQVKDAYQFTLNQKGTNQELNIVFQGALSNAKRIKTDTKLSNTPISIGALTANRILDYVATSPGKTILIVGITGKIGSIIAKNLCGKSDLNIIGTTRRYNSSHELFGESKQIKMVEYKDRYQCLKVADVIVSATTSPHYTFTFNEVVEELKDGTHHKLWIDLAVPGDIDKDILNRSGMEIMDIDDFEIASTENNRRKLKELEKAEFILDNCMEETLKNIYFQRFYGTMKDIEKRIEQKGFKYILCQMKKSLNSEQLGLVLDSLQEISKENPGR